MKLSNTERLRRFYSCFSGEDQVLVLINADPDAIASALAVKRMLWRKVACVKIACVNVVQRPDNLAMIRLLGVDLLPIEETDGRRFTRFVLVDSQPNHHPSLAPYAFDVIIDHHPDTGATATYTDIRPKYGATASILTEYLRAARIKPSAKLATSLYYAIKTDTSNFQRQALIEDVRAFQFLFRHANTTLARRIDQADLRIGYLKYFKSAIQNRRVRKGKLFAHLGAVESPDVLVIIADFFMRVESMNWSVVSGTWDRKLVVIFRNDGLRQNAGKVAKQSFGALGSAGGHKSMARAEIELSELRETVKINDAKVLQSWIIARITQRVDRRIPLNGKKS